MQLGVLAERLNRMFELERYAEPNGWDFALSTEERAHLLVHATPTFRATFNGLIPMSVEFDAEIGRIYGVVFPEALLLDRVIESERERGCPGAMILTHHPVDMETSGRGFIAIPPARLEELAQARIAIYVLHAPLDCHPEISTSGALADGLGLRRDGTFAPYVGGDCGVIGVQDPEPFSSFAEQVRLLCELPGFNLDQVRFAGRMVTRVGIVAGGGDEPSYLAQAEELGCDAYLAGHWWTPHVGEWCDWNRAQMRDAIKTSPMNLLSGSHDGTELVVFRDRLMPLLASWGIETELIRQTDHWR
jgi:putative NIF3 family GTP cyclohydrolase 1 type 2